MRSRILISIPLIIFGLLLTQYQNDRKFIDLSPTAGVVNSVTLNNEDSVTQTFTIQHRTITRLGFYLRPAAKNIPAGNITIFVSQNNTDLGSAAVSSAFVDSEGATQFRFDPPLEVDKEQPVTARITVDEALSGAIRLQLRQPDDEVDPESVRLFINNNPQSAPAAYIAASVIRPPLAIQIGSLFILSGFLLMKYSIILYILTAPLIFILPYISIEAPLLPVYFYSAIALTGFYTLARLLSLPLLASVFGANVFAFTTWYPLHYYDNRSLYIFAALLPFLTILLIIPKKGGLKNKYAFSIFLLIIASLLIINYNFNSPPELQAAVPRDVFLDPQQSPLSVKASAPWTNYGAYIGIIPLAFAVIGFLSGAANNFLRTYKRSREYKRYFNSLIYYSFAVTFALVFLPDVANIASRFNFPAPHLVILTVFFIAIFAADGFHSLFRFLFPARDKEYWVPLILAYSVIILSLLDLWHVSATVLERI